MNGWHELMIAQVYYEELEHDAEVRREQHEAMEKVEHRNLAKEIVEEVEHWLKHDRKPEKKPNE